MPMDPNGTAHGGHLIEAYVRPTLEVELTEASLPLRKIIESGGEFERQEQGSQGNE
jgi:predicted DNA-binding protein with PD1-like motif